MKRYIAQFVKGGFPELYAVRDTQEGALITDGKPYHEANDEAEARNNGTFGQPQVVNFSGLYGWAAQLPDAP